MGGTTMVFDGILVYVYIYITYYIYIYINSIGKPWDNSKTY